MNADKIPTTNLSDKVLAQLKLARSVPYMQTKEKNINGSYNYLFNELAQKFMEGVGSIYYTYMYNKTRSCTAYLTVCPEAAEDGPFSSFK